MPFTNLLYCLLLHQVALQAVFEGILNKMKEVDEVSGTVSTLLHLDGKLPFRVASLL